MHLSNSVSDEHAIIFVAENLSQEDAEPEETEQLEILRVPVIDAINMVLSGKITDSMSVAALLKLKIIKGY